jgi:hypothetical protein
VTGSAFQTEEKLSKLLDDLKFQELDARYRKFNFFSALDAAHVELRHSNFLAFMLSPNESHGLGAGFLSRVLRLFLTKLQGASRPISSLELQLANLDSAFVERERDNIDISIEVPPLNLVVIIENKIKSSVSDGQLTRYKEIVQRKYKGWHQIFVLLTPEGYDAGEYDFDYIACGYGELVELLSGYLGQTRSSLSPEVALVLDHYIEMVRGSVVDDEKLKELARQLYYRHKDAFEFVFRSRPDLLDPLRSVIEANDKLVLDRGNPQMIRFAPAAWAHFPALNACPKSEWTRTGRNLLFEVKANKITERVSVGLVLGPGEDRFREHMYSNAKKRRSIFVGLVDPMGRKFSTIFIRDLLSASAAENTEYEEKVAAIEAAWEIFLTNDLPALKSEVDGIVQLYEQSPQSTGVLST